MTCKRCKTTNVSGLKVDFEVFKNYAEQEEKAAKNMRAFSEVVQKIKQRRGLIWRIKEKFGKKEKVAVEGTEIVNGEVNVKKERRRIFGGGLFNRKDGFFSPERTEKRRAFRVKVSGNRKWIMIGVAVVAVCGTIIYLSVTYGGGGFGFIKNLF